MNDNITKKEALKTDMEFQSELLLGVSRTFALTIPQLPEDLRNVVSNAYLLCRAVDTIEDEPALNVEEKKRFCQWFVDIVNYKSNPVLFSNALAPLLSDSTIAMEHELIKKIDRVLEITSEFDKSYQESLSRCVRIMSDGMASFQEVDSTAGLPTLKDLDNYCYYVAGVVGEMLTDLFSIYLPHQIGPKKDKMMSLATSFGQALQMTNILKDVWDDKKRGVCWLPQDVFNSYGFDLNTLKVGQTDENFQKGMLHLIGVANAHILNAFNYTLMIPAKESGIRNFCLWALFMAILTLQEIRKNIDSTKNADWKINRAAVKRIVVISKLTSKHDWALKLFFKITSRGLPMRSATFKN